MPRQFVLECLVDLPTDAHELADTIAKTRAPWQALLDSLNTGGITYQQRSAIMETKAKAAVTGAKRGRKPKLHPALPQPSLADAAE